MHRAQQWKVRRSRGCYFSVCAHVCICHAQLSAQVCVGVWVMG